MMPEVYVVTINCNKEYFMYGNSKCLDSDNYVSK